MAATNSSGDAMYRKPPPGNTNDKPKARTDGELDSTSMAVPTTTRTASTPTKPHDQLAAHRAEARRPLRQEEDAVRLQLAVPAVWPS